MQRLLALAVFLLVVVATAAFSGQFVGGEWYQEVVQPSWNPPPLMMACVWAVLYALMAVSAWMVCDTMRGVAGSVLGWWVVQLMLNVTWSWLYFGLNRTGYAQLIMALWLAVVLLTIRAFHSIKPEAAWLMIPVAVWLFFVMLLNFSQWYLNGGGWHTVF